MLDKKRILKVGIFIILIAIVIGTYIVMKNKKEENQITDYTPEEEITEAQLRQTMISLYFKSEDKLIPEARLIDVKELINNPYEIILKMLIDGPKNENLKNTIPKETKINKAEKDGEILIVDFSEDFLSKHPNGEIEERLTIESLVKSLTELTEINGIKIQINGEDNKCFSDGIIKFDKIFTRDSMA